ncbi:metalloregulator ArsR/SmtB family transcription factor [Cellulomonas sp. HZM]|uniref:helix-turn-helix transcriptional regulator n=1 Tax=Cellulomonas sp. HZM TaxID=1454010 RepID=UPI000493ADD6|nr:helix-turn-helix domain-containing protein [Cellulomonas sp. HZM]
MSATTPLEHAPSAPPALVHEPEPSSDAGTRQRVLQLVASDGPVTATELASDLDLTATAVRRHLGVLEHAGQIVVHTSNVPPAGRGRPARRYVATSAGQASLTQRYADLATQALRFLGESAGQAAVTAFAEQRVRDLEQRLALVVRGEDDVEARAHRIADALTAEGYAASARPVPGTAAVQLCQGHCPVQDVAHEFPQLCEAEARAFSRVLGVHVQRLATLAAGGHVCTTSIPVPPPAPVLAPEGSTA